MGRFSECCQVFSRRIFFGPLLFLACAAHFLGAVHAHGKTAEDRSAGEIPGEDEELLILDPVVVTATRLPSIWEEIPASVSVVDREEIQQGKPAVTLDSGLVRVPGVFVQNSFNFAQDQRISIRGFGARSAFGIRGIQVYVDGIPHTLPDGQTQIDSIDPSAIERIEVIRGPMSALYGNSSGGVINIILQDGPEEPYLESKTVVGEYDLWKTVLKGGGETERMNLFVNVSRLEVDGFREHGEAESWKMLGKLRYEPDKESDLTFVLDSVYSPELNDPGGLTLEQVEEDRSRAAPNALQFDIGEEVKAGRLGFIYRRQLSLDQDIEAAGYYGRRDLDNSIPFRFIELERDVYGGRFQYAVRGSGFGLPQELFAGIDIQNQQDNRLNFDNDGGSPGDTLLLDQDEQVTGMGVYLQDEIELTERFSVTVGGRYDWVRFEVDDHLEEDGDDSGSTHFDEVTGRFGLMYELRPNVQAYGSIAQSFETPTSTEIVNRPEGGGGINPDIEAQEAINYEVGVKGSGFDRFHYDLAVFFIELEDELIAFRDATDRVFYRNAGESQRKGAEVSIGVEILAGLEAGLSYTYLQAEFDEYVKDGTDLQGNEIPGLPNHLLFGEILYEHPSGFYAGCDILYAGGFFVNDENTLETDDYVLGNVRAGYRKVLGGWRIEPFAGVQNLFDEEYNSNVRINARGERYFEPAPGRNHYGGIAIGYEL
ncbi:MAG: TonB-dependent receptor family protein [Desulfovibrionales bacterium]